MKDIVAIGEVLIDLTQKGVDENGVAQYAANPGGAPANLAVAAARLGAKTAFVGKVGRDAFGNSLRAVLEANDVDTQGLLEDGKEHTTLAVVSVDETGELTPAPAFEKYAAELDIRGQNDSAWQALAEKLGSVAQGLFQVLKDAEMENPWLRVEV